MGCSGCQSRSVNRDVFVKINGIEYHVGTRVLTIYLKGIAADFEEGVTYSYEQENRTTNASFTGTIEFKKGHPYVNGRRML